MGAIFLNLEKMKSLLTNYKLTLCVLGGIVPNMCKIENNNHFGLGIIKKQKLPFTSYIKNSILVKYDLRLSFIAQRGKFKLTFKCDFLLFFFSVHGLFYFYLIFSLGIDILLGSKSWFIFN